MSGTDRELDDQFDEDEGLVELDWDDDDEDALSSSELDPEHIRIFTPEEEQESDEDLDLEASASRSERPELATVLDDLELGNRQYATLYGLSDLSRSDAAELAARWPRIEPDIRLSVVRELVDLGQSELHLDLTRFLLTASNDDDARVRQVAVAGLALEEHRSIPSRLLTILREDPSDDVRAEAASALGPFVELTEAEELDPEVEAELRRVLLFVAEDEDESWHIRRRAAESASHFGPSAEVDRLIRRMWEEDEIGLRGSALYAIGRANQRSWIPVVLESLNDEDPEIRFEAVRAAGQLGDVEALPMLSEIALKEEDVDVRQSAIAAIGEIGGQGATRILTRLFEQAPESDHELITDAMLEATIGDDVPFDEF
jgi:HEAT repeat protein